MYINKDKIIEIYDSFLGRFQFFRDFVKVLLQIEADIEVIEENHREANQRILDLEVLTIKLQNRIVELENATPQESKALFEPRTAHSILEKYQEAFSSPKE